jgi:hypothetical protein
MWLRFRKHVDMLVRALLTCADSSGWERTEREIVDAIRLWAELVALRADSLGYLATHLEQLERLLIELPEGSLTADEFRTLRRLVDGLKRSLP